LAFAPYSEYLKNFSLMLTVILEERNQRSLNEQHKRNLEQRVKERTAELEKEIEERKNAEQALRCSEERFTLAMKGANDGLWDWNLETDEVYFSPRWKSMLGYSPEELSNRLETWSNKLHPDDQSQAYLAVEGYLAGKGEPFSIEFRMHHKQGHYVPIRSRGYAVRDKSGKATRFVGTHIDITERKHNEMQIHQLNQELEQRVIERTSKLEESQQTLKRAEYQLVESEKMASLGELVAGVAHEINTPLGIGVTAASFLVSESSDFQNLVENKQVTQAKLELYIQDIAKGANLILGNLQRAAELVKSFKQVAVDQNQLKSEIFNVHEHLSSVLTSLNPRLKSTPFTIDLDCPKQLQTTGFPGVWSQIITNLVMNSLVHGFHNREHGNIKIAIQLQEEQILWSYQDDGLGMTEDTRQHIFEAFFTTNRDRGGSGLGMHIVYNLVTQTLGGEISCESSPNSGTSFLISLPILEADVEI